MKQFYKKLIPSVLCFIMIIGNIFSVFGDGGSFNYSKLYIKNGSGVYENTTSNIITLKNYPTKIVFKRTDPDESVNVSGSHITIFDSDNNEVISFITGSEPKKLDGLLNGGETYTIKETKASYGHTPEVSELEIKVQNIADEQVFVIKDKVDDENGYWKLLENDSSINTYIDNGEKKNSPWLYPSDIITYNVSKYNYLSISHIFSSGLIDLLDENNNVIASQGSFYNYDISNYSLIKVRFNDENQSAPLDITLKGDSNKYGKGVFYYYKDSTNVNTLGNDISEMITVSNCDHVSYIYRSDNETNFSELYISDLRDYSDYYSYDSNNHTMSFKSDLFIPKYQTTYYNLVYRNYGTGKSYEYKIKIELPQSGIEVYGFQINASNSDGSASEYCPSFRTMSRSDKLQVKSDDTSDNKRLYPVENYGTVYAPNSVDDSEMTVLSDKAMHYQAHDEGFFENYNNDEYSMYYALTLKNLFYRYHNLTDKYKFRAYCELEDGTIIYSDNICTASVKDVAEAVYDKKISYSNITHQWIYDYVIYPTSLKSNIVDITYFLLEMTDAQSKSDLEYALCNQWYKDANYWCNNSFDYEKVSYYDRGTKFVCTSEITHNGKTYNVESALLEILNDISGTKYDTVSDWIYFNQKEYQFEGIAYQKEFINNQMIIFD